MYIARATRGRGSQVTCQNSMVGDKVPTVQRSGFRRWESCARRLTTKLAWEETERSNQAKTSIPSSSLEAEDPQLQ